MEKLMKTSKTVDTILKVLYRIMMVAGIILLVSIGICVIAEVVGELPISEVSGISIGDVELVFSESVTVSKPFVLIEMGTVLVSALIMIAITGYMIKLLRNVLAPMIIGQPFNGTVSGNMKKLGIVVIIGGVVLDVVESISSNIAFYLYDVAEMFLSDAVSSITVNSTIGLDSILVGVLVILLSHVFRYGEELQQQADETL